MADEKASTNRQDNASNRLDSPLAKGVTIAAAVVAILALGLWVYQLTVGLAVTNMRNLNSWGLYITNFMFLVGLSAGGLIMSSIPRVFNVEGFGGISKIAVWTSICCTVLAIGFVLVDMGNPIRVWELFVFSNFNSPLLWDVCILSTYLVLSIAYLVLMLRHEAGSVGSGTLRVVSSIALVTAILVHSVTAWVFGLQASHEFWHTALLAPWFVSSALVSGTGLVMVVIIVLRKIGYIDTEWRYVEKMAKFLGAFILVDLYFFGCDLLTSGFGQTESGLGVVSMLTSGVLAPYFWFEVVGGLLAAGICFVPKLRTQKMLACAALLAVLGVFCKRVQLLVGGFQNPNLAYAMPQNGTSLTDIGQSISNAFPAIVYVPTPFEFAIVAGVFALGLLGLMVGLRYLPLKPTDKTE